MTPFHILLMNPITLLGSARKGTWLTLLKSVSAPREALCNVKSYSKGEISPVKFFFKLRKSMLKTLSTWNNNFGSLHHELKWRVSCHWSSRLISNDVPDANVWIPKVAHIQGHLIFKLIILRYWLIHFIISHFFTCFKKKNII